MFTFIPVTLLSMAPIPVLRWILVGLGAGSSGWFLSVSPLPPFPSPLLLLPTL